MGEVGILSGRMGTSALARMSTLVEAVSVARLLSHARPRWLADEGWSPRFAACGSEPCTREIGTGSRQAPKFMAHRQERVGLRGSNSPQEPFIASKVELIPVEVESIPLGDQ